METHALTQKIQAVMKNNYTQIESNATELNTFIETLQKENIIENGKKWLYKLREQIRLLYNHCHNQNTNSEEQQTNNKEQLIQLFALSSYYLVEQQLIRSIIAESELKSNP